MPDADAPSPYAPAYVARVSDPKGDRLSATLVPRHLGFLSIKVTFHKIPCPGLEVKLSEANPDGTKGKSVGDPQKTDEWGYVTVDYLVPAGPYVCEIEGQAETFAVTVDDPEKPFSIVLPVDRPYHDVDEEPEYDDADRKIEDVKLPGGDAGMNLGDDDGGVCSVALGVKSKDDLGDQFPRFVLESADGSYRREVIAKTNTYDGGDGWLYVAFSGLDEDADTTYRLTHVRDAGSSEVVFDGESYDTIVDQEHPANAALADHAYAEADVDDGSKTANPTWS
jgi:hypothetical protein